MLLMLDSSARHEKLHRDTCANSVNWYLLWLLGRSTVTRLADDVLHTCILFLCFSETEWNCMFWIACRLPNMRKMLYIAAFMWVLMFCFLSKSTMSMHSQWIYEVETVHNGEIIQALVSCDNSKMVQWYCSDAAKRNHLRRQECHCSTAVFFWKKPPHSLTYIWN